MVTVAVRAPVAAGVKLMLIVQLAPGATEPAPVGQVLPAAKAKSAACAPVMVMLVRFSGAPPLLVSVTFCAALVVPTRCLPKGLLVAESVAVGGVTPVPVSDTDCGLSAASSVMFTVAARAPVAAGVKLKLNVQLAPCGTEPAPVGQVLPAAKAKSAACGPMMVMLVRFSGSSLMILRPPRSTLLPYTTRCRSKGLLVAESVAVGGVTPVPVSGTDCGLSAASSVMFTVAARAPVAAGVKLMLIVQLAPGATELARVGEVLRAAKSKSAACAPVMVMLVRFSGAPPLLVRVTVCAALVVPTRCLPKALLVAESVAVGGVTPVPVSDTDCGLPAASSVMVTVAVRALAAVGEGEIENAIGARRQRRTVDAGGAGGQCEVASVGAAQHGGRNAEGGGAAVGQGHGLHGAGGADPLRAEGQVGGRQGDSRSDAGTRKGHRLRAAHRIVSNVHRGGPSAGGRRSKADADRATRSRGH